MTRLARLHFWFFTTCLVILVLFGGTGPMTLMADVIAAFGMIACLGWKS